MIQCVDFPRTLEISTDYSGIDCPREALTVGISGIERSLESKGLHMGSSRSDCLKFTRACDIGPVQQTVLSTLANRQDGSQSCVHPDVECRLADTAKTWLDAAMPSTSAAAASAYADMQAWLLANSAWAFPPNKKVPCLVHQECYACGKAATSREQYVQAGKRRRLGTAAKGRPVKLNIAGVPCTAWTSMGAQARFAHATERPHAVWLAERKARDQRNET